MLRNDLLVGVVAIIRTAHPSNYEKIADGWKMSADEKRMLLACGEFFKAFRNSRTVHDMFLFAYFNNHNETLAETLLAATDRLSEIDSFYRLWDSIRPLPINGNDVMAEGWEGKEIGEKLALMRSIFFLRNFKPDREEMLDVLSEYSLQYGKEIKHA